MLIVVIATPQDISFPFIHDIYLLMVFASVIGMLLFSIVIKETRRNMNSELSYEEQKFNEFENEIKELKKEIEELKNEKNSS